MWGGEDILFSVSKQKIKSYNFISKHIWKGGSVFMKIVLIRPSGILTKVLRKMFGIKKNK